MPQSKKHVDILTDEILGSPNGSSSPFGLMSRANECVYVLAGFTSVCWCMHVRSLREMRCGFSHRTEHEPYLPYLLRIPKYSYVTLAHEEKEKERDRAEHIHKRVSSTRSCRA